MTHLTLFEGGLTSVGGTYLKADVYVYLDLGDGVSSGIIAAL